MSTALGEKRQHENASARFVALLLVASLAFALLSIWQIYAAYAGSRGLIAAPGHPLGADFINLWTAAQLLLEGRWNDIYAVEAFMAFQQTLVGESIGHRIWAYPPHSLLFAWPFGLIGYQASFLIWMVLGLAVLAFGARRFGFDWLETGVLLLCPAALTCVGQGQTGNLACGLLLLAFADSKRDRFSMAAALAAAVLTIKPQSGFLLPLFWLFRRRWLTIGAAAVLTVALVVASIAIFGTAPWRDYSGDTLRELSELERYGRGPFLYMIPSTFISVRLLGYDADIASAVHFIVAGLVFLLLLWALRRESDATRQAALVLVGTSIITPYQHSYDLTMLMAAGLIVLRGADAFSQGLRLAALIAASVCWMMPKLVGYLGSSGVPISPVLIFGVLVALIVVSPSGRKADAAH